MDLKGTYLPSESRYDDADKLYNRCGRSGVKLPKVSLGFWHNFGGVDAYERSRAITHYALDHGISRMARGQFLTQDKLTAELLDYLRKLNQTAKQRGESLAGMALAWILQQPGVTSVLVGASSTAQLEKNMECVQAKPIPQLSM